MSRLTPFGGEFRLTPLPTPPTASWVGLHTAALAVCQGLAAYICCRLALAAVHPYLVVLVCPYCATVWHLGRVWAAPAVCVMCAAVA